MMNHLILPQIQLGVYIYNAPNSPLRRVAQIRRMINWRCSSERDDGNRNDNDDDG